MLSSSSSQFSSKSLLIACFFALMMVFITQYQSFFDKRTTIVFCDVGQGDGAYIRVQNQIDILIDAGPDKKMLDCLGRHMPFFDRTIELAFLSHPQKDHYGGYLYILQKYKIDRFITSPVDNDNNSWSKLKQTLKIKSVETKPYYAGDRIKIQDAYLDFYWPKKDYVSKFSKNFKDLNNFSQVFIFRQGSFKVLFTGDLTKEIEEILLEQSIPKVNILKVPHHGSKNALNKKFFELADPDTSVISVGRNNRYGHPSQVILDMLGALKTKIKRTDKDGEVVFRVNSD